MNSYRFIDLFRALAAFWVLAAHCMIWGGWNGLHVPNPKIAVDLFMLVSGFLMASNAQARWAVEPLDEPAARLRFWLRRYFRLSPVFYLALGCVVVGAPMFLAGKAYLQSFNPAFPPGGIYDPALVHYTIDNILMHATFASGLHPFYVVSASLPDWSLSLEVQFYLAFPLLVIYLKRGRSLFLAGLVAMLVAPLVQAMVYFPEPSLLAFKLHYFIAGMLLHRAICADGVQRIGLAAGATLLTATGTQYGIQIVLGPLLLLAMMALGIMERDGQTPVLLDRFASSRVVSYGSSAAYAVYLFHGLLIGAFGFMLSQFGLTLSPMMRSLTMFVFVFPAGYAVAWPVMRYVERPGIALGRAVNGWLSGRVGLVRVP